MNKPIDMKELMEKLESINEGGEEVAKRTGELQDKGVVHASSTRALARDIVAYAKKIAESHGYDITTESGAQVWEGIMIRQLSDAVKGLEEYVTEERISIEYQAKRGF